MNETIVYAKELNEKEKRDVWALLVMADHEFVPPLSEREGTLDRELAHPAFREEEGPHAYFGALLRQEFLLAKEGERVVGFMSYIPDHLVKVEDGRSFRADYVSTVIVHPSHRGRNLTERFYECLHVEGKGDYMATRTWSTNYAHLHVLEKVGFTLLCTIPDDRGRDIDTLYYSKER